MTFWTIQINSGPGAGKEMVLEDDYCFAATRDVANMSKDAVELTLQSPADAPDLFPYGTKITIRRNRAAAGGPAANAAANAAGLPGTGFTAFSGGTIFFVGYSTQNRRRAGAQEESFNYRFAGPWEFFMETTILQQLYFSYSAAAAANVACYRSQFVLGLSLNTLYGTADTVSGSNATNLMSIRQVIIQIVQYCIAQTATLAQYGSSPQFQFDSLTSGGNNTSFTLNANTLAELVAAGAKCLIPDFVPGFEESAQTNQGLPTTTVSGAQFNVALRAPLDTVNDITCAEAMRYELKWLVGFLGSVSVWMDYTTTPPTLHVATRDILATTGAVNLPFPVAPSAPLTGPQKQTFYLAASDIVRRDDLVPDAVALKFRILGSINGSPTSMLIHDIATEISDAVVEGIGFDGGLCAAATFLGDPTGYLAGGTQTALVAASLTSRSKIATVDMEGSASQTCVVNTIPVNTGDPASVGDALAMWEFLEPRLRTVTNLAIYSGSSVTAIDDTGASIDLTEYQYILLDNSLPQWLSTAVSGDPLVKQATLIGYMKYTEVATLPSGTPPTTKVVPFKEIRAHATLIRIPGGVYATGTGSEIIPFGLAGYIFNIEQIAQFEGSLTIQEQEISDLVPLGSALNLTGSANADWATMNAQVQSIRYDIMAGRTEIHFGPAKHLGAKDIVDLNRANRGPRPYYLIGGNLTNSGATNSGSPTYNAQRGPSPGSEQHQLLIEHTSLPDSQTYAADYVYGLPGITHDTRASGQPAYGNGGTYSLDSPTDPTIHLQGGSGGSYTGCVRLSVTDVKGAQTWLHEYPVCFDFDDDEGPVNAYVLLMGSEPYHDIGDPTGG